MFSGCACEKSCAFCYIHIGPSPVPIHILDSIHQTQAWNPLIPIYVVVEGSQKDQLRERLATTKTDSSKIVLVPANSLVRTPHHEQFCLAQRFDESFWHGFWRYTTERLFVLEELMRTFQLRDVVHLESDMMIYFSLERFLPLFQEYGPIAMMKEAPGRASAGLVFVSQPDAIRPLNQYLSEKGPDGIDEMTNLGRYQQCHDDSFRLLPILMPEYGDELAADYSRGFDKFQSIFDAAALGIYLGGIDPRARPLTSDTWPVAVLRGLWQWLGAPIVRTCAHIFPLDFIDRLRRSLRSGVLAPSVKIPTPEPGYVSEWCVFDCRKLEFAWRCDSATMLRRPLCRVRNPPGRWVEVNNLHIHSKSLRPFSSRSDSPAHQAA